MTARAAGPAAATITFPAMATRVTVRVAGPHPGAASALASARAVFARVEGACTRFDPGSPLMRANADPAVWHTVPEECYLAVAEAARAHEETDGLFDPRVLDTLVALGYDRTLPFRAGVTLTGTGRRLTGREPADPPRWQPGLNRDSRSIRLGPHRVDLGGIGKGLAVRLAAQALARAGGGHLIEAGGDCHVAGDGPDGDGWRIGVEDPAGGVDPVAVLRVTDTGCATSSLRVRSWRVGGATVHHLIDPRTGRSAEGGLRSVTVLDPDPARAEVWSKSLLIAGRQDIAELAARRRLPALWVDENGRLGASAAMTPYVIWTVPDAS
jgi:thiamine biosynthesis lipoprotein